MGSFLPSLTLLDVGRVVIGGFLLAARIQDQASVRLTVSGEYRGFIKPHPHGRAGG